MEEYFQAFIPKIQQWLEQLLPPETQTSYSNYLNGKAEVSADIQTDDMSPNPESQTHSLS